MSIKKMTARWDSRKLHIWAILFIASTIMYAIGDKVTFEQWSNFQIWNASIFGGGNAVEYLTGSNKGTANSGMAGQPSVQTTAQISEPEI